jgi:hypothetical protein
MPGEHPDQPAAVRLEPLDAVAEGFEERQRARIRHGPPAR